MVKDTVAESKMSRGGEQISPEDESEELEPFYGGYEEENTQGVREEISHLDGQNNGT